MMSEESTERWHQRRDEFRRAVELLKRTDAIRRERALTEAEEAGLVQFFGLAVELGWKSMAGFLRAEGVVFRTLSGLNVIREAMRSRVIPDGDAWSAAVELRNIMAHTYDPDAFHALVADAVPKFLPMFEQLRVRLDALS